MTIIEQLRKEDVRRRAATLRRLRERDRAYAANNPDALAPTRGRIPSGRGGSITDIYQPRH